jgi:hypothetical protein
MSARSAEALVIGRNDQCLSMPRLPRHGALFERRVGQLPNIGSIGAHHMNVAVWLWIAWMQCGLVFECTARAREGDLLAIG